MSGCIISKQSERESWCYNGNGRQGGPPEGPPFFLVENSIIITFTELIYGLVLYGFVTGKTNPYEHKTIEPAIQGQVYFYKDNWMISGKCKQISMIFTLNFRFKIILWRLSYQYGIDGKPVKTHKNHLSCGNPPKDNFLCSKFLKIIFRGANF